jgi:peptide/nickel transport system ATP-binding protein/oligopeptide transport system ATP-binding protein
VTTPVLAVRDLVKRFPVRRGVLRRRVGAVHAVDGVSFSIASGETLGLVGESGCGKSTVAKLVMRLIAPSAGTIEWGGSVITAMPRRALQPLRRFAQIVFQDPYASLNPRFTAAAIVGEPLLVHRIGDAVARRERVVKLFERVGLRRDQIDLYPHQFSGGQRQRLAIARALALEPQLIVLDEPISALDVSIQAQVVNLLADLQRDTGCAYLFISHDLAVVEHLSRRIAVMYLGRIVEIGFARDVFDAPIHPYSEALIAALPLAEPAARAELRARVQGDVPSPIDPPSGCRFHTRCPHAEPRCRSESPVLREVAPGRLVACHLR